MSNATATTVDATIVPHPGDLYDCQYHFGKPLTYVSARQRARLLIFRSRLRDAYPATYPAV